MAVWPSRPAKSPRAQAERSGESAIPSRHDPPSRPRGAASDRAAGLRHFRRGAEPAIQLGAEHARRFYGAQGDGVSPTMPRAALRHKLVAGEAGYALAQFQTAANQAVARRHRVSDARLERQFCPRDREPERGRLPFAARVTGCLKAEAELEQLDRRCGRCPAGTARRAAAAKVQPVPATRSSRSPRSGPVAPRGRARSCSQRKPRTVSRRLVFEEAADAATGRPRTKRAARRLGGPSSRTRG